MLSRLIGLVPLEGIKIIVVLFLSFLIGLEREEHNFAAAEGGERYSFGGVRTFPLIGLLGYAMALLSGNQLLLLAAGFLAVAAFLWLSYQHKLQRYGQAGVTTEVSGLLTYIVGALVSRGEFWIATTLAIVGLLLLELKVMLESLSRRLPGEEVLPFAKFLLLTAVILPVLPDRTFGSFGLNPFKAWLIVVAASGISYASYLVQKFVRQRGSLFATALLGGAYSSTLTTVVLAKRARHQEMPRLYAGGILMASGVMYLRLLVLVGFFNGTLMMRLLVPFALLGGASLLGGWLWGRPQADNAAAETSVVVKNPLELSAAFLFALLFVVLLVATQYAAAYFGRGGVYGLAALTGVTDIDPFVLGLTQAGAAHPLSLAAAGIVIAAASNNLVKGCYAAGFSDRRTGRQALGLLAALALLGLLPLLF